MIILKFFLHVSKEEQKKRFLERINDPSKNWKFSSADLKERNYWNDYQKAYEEMLSSTSTGYAPWFVIPADDKWFARLCLSVIICQEFEKLNLKYPVVSAEQKKDLLAAKQILLKEKK
jgi:polyphosphate kinase 2 (PPK2 family)